MKRSALLIAALCALMPALVSAQTVIKMTDAGFVPDTVRIAPGSMVVFENADTTDHWPASNPHPVHTILPALDPRHPVTPGDTWSFAFTSAGTWHFHDHLYPNFTGTIIVGGGPTGTAMATSTSLISRLWSSWVQTLASLWRATPFSKSLRERALPAPAPLSASEIDALYKKWTFPCSERDFTCTADELKRVTAAYGPQVATAFLKRLQQGEKIDPSVDDHQIAHQIGRETARVFGQTSGAFLLCPMSEYNGGCQHGFFEYVLGQAKTGAAAAEKICGPMQGGYSAKVYFDCYHGVGHGVMMAEAYDLPASLAVCDSLKDPVGQDGCWQGVFMENVNGAMTGVARPGVFSREDPLLPCTVVGKKYQHECFINQAGWLVGVAGNSVPKATRACLAAPADQRESCLQSIGLMVTNPSWQSNLAPRGTGLAANAWHICQQFPAGYVDQCLIGAIDNLMNFDQLDTTRSAALCALTPVSLRDACYRQIGVNIRRQASKSTDVGALCDALAGKSACLKGAETTP